MVVQLSGTKRLVNHVFVTADAATAGLVGIKESQGESQVQKGP